MTIDGERGGGGEEEREEERAKKPYESCETIRIRSFKSNTCFSLQRNKAKNILRERTKTVVTNLCFTGLVPFSQAANVRRVLWTLLLLAFGVSKNLNEFLSHIFIIIRCNVYFFGIFGPNTCNFNCMKFLLKMLRN